MMSHTHKVQTCNCGKIEGKKTLLSNFVRIGITTKFSDNGVFVDNKELCIDNNFCPQCGAEYTEVIHECIGDRSGL